MKMPATETGKRLTQARIRAGYDGAAEFSRQHGIPQSTYALHESGRRSLRPPTAERYAGLLGNCTPEWLLYGTGNGPSVPPHMSRPVAASSSEGQIDRESEEMAAFMLLYDRLAILTKENENTGLDEFGVVPRLYGFGHDARGAVQLTFHLWQQIINQETDQPLIDRVLARLGEIEVGMREMFETFRKVHRMIEGKPPG